MKYTRRNILQSMGALAGASMIPVTSDGQPMTGKTPEDLQEIINLFDFEKMAAGKMSKMAYEFVASGAADEFTVKWNRGALDKLKIQTEVLNDVARLDTRVTLFGKEMP
jgi:4-hydroxymandelate oxidase